MADYIDKESLLHKIGQIPIAWEYGQAVKDIYDMVKNEPAAEVAPVVRCKNCIYWKDRHIKLDDGTERPYTEEELQEFCGMVPLSIGINVSSYCTRVKLEDTNFWCGPDDFCSKGARMNGTEDNEK